MMLSQYEKPQIVIACTRDAEKVNVRALCAGIEEEMIPYQIKTVPEARLADMAFSACESSRLEVGIALCGNACALHFAKLERAHPLFVLEGAQINKESLLTLGANAARLVKGVPFKE